MARLYDIFDNKNSKYFAENKNIQEAAELLGVTEDIIRKAIKNSSLIGKRYFIIYKGVVDVTQKWTIQQQEEWNRVRMLFHNVEWVKEDGPGVKVLTKK